MKKYIYYFLVVVLAVSCQNSSDLLDLSPSSSSDVTSNNLTWDKCEYCMINKKKVSLPWSETSEEGISLDVRKDINPTNGWRLIYSSVPFVGSNQEYNYQAGAYYIVLYNKYTGMLKGFVHNNNMQSNNTAFWQLTIDENSKLFNFADYFAVSKDKSLSQQIIVSNTGSNGLVQGFDKGWNCFMQELAYDENSVNQHLSLQAFALNKAQFNFTGVYKDISSGTIVTAVTKNKYEGVVDGIASAVGDHAKDWIENSLKDKDASGFKEYAIEAAGSVAKSGAKAIVSYGLNKVLGSVLGGTSSDSTIQNIRISTNGHVSIKGESAFPSAGYIMPLSGIPFRTLHEPLGVWNLEETPKFVIPCVSKLYKIDFPPEYTCYNYKVEGKTNAKIKVNPYVDADIKLSTSLVDYDKYNNKSLNSFEPNKKLAIFDSNKTSDYYLLFQDSVTTIYNMPTTYYVLAPNTLPNKTTIDNKPAYDFSNGVYDARHNAIMKVVVKIQKQDLQYYSAKTFIPNVEYETTNSARPYNWTYHELNNLGY